MSFIIDLLIFLLFDMFSVHVFLAAVLAVAAGMITSYLGAPDYAGSAMIGALVAYALAYAFLATGRGHRRATHDGEKP